MKIKSLIGLSLLLTSILVGCTPENKNYNLETSLLLGLTSSSSPDDLTPFLVPDSNQTICYDSSGTSRPCSGTGEDGEFLNTPAPYSLQIQDGGTTVLEESSRLIWQRCTFGSNWNGTTCQGGPLNLYWQAADEYCSSLTLAGRTWRLPTAREASLFGDFSQTNAVSSVYFPNTSVNTHWASTPVTSFFGRYSAYSNGEIGQSDQNNGLKVRCVSGPKIPQANFTDLGNGTIKEENTGLLIKKCAQGQTDDSNCTGTPTIFNWQQALDACNNLDFAGRTDWRLPTAREAYFHSEPSYGTIDLPFDYFPNNTQASNAWTSTSTSYFTHAYTQNSFSLVAVSKSNTVSTRARCVAGP